MSLDPQTLEIPIGSDVFQAALLGGDPSDWVSFEAELIDAGVPIPLPNRVAWAQANPDRPHRYLTVRNGQGGAEAGVVVLIQNSRPIPGWRLARTERIGPARSEEGRRALLTGLSRIPLLEPRILRLGVGVFSAEAKCLSQCAGHLEAIGFRRAPRPRSYLRTLTLQLSPSAEELFSQLHPTARRHIRATTKKPVSIRAVVDPSLADRLGELSRETHARTRSVPPARDWNAVIRFSAAHPGLSRILGLFADDRHDSSRLLSFAWSCFHGDHAHYEAGASTREPELKVPLAYGLMWELILWAKASGGTFFEFGGVPLRSPGPDDPLFGIQKFKKCFASEVSEVGAEFSLEPNAALGSASRAVSSAVRWMKNRLDSQMERS
ncbi:MAG: GNAT family N-acetyltransferase [Gemmatimonadota bacterium]